MNFVNNTITSCPTCGCTSIIREYYKTHINGEILIHTNGSKWENREFSCGFRCEYVPNFSKVIIDDYYKCKHDKDALFIKTNRNNLIYDLLDYMSATNYLDDNRMKPFHQKITQILKDLYR